MSELVSVIIPVYNVEKYLHECLESVISQTYKNIEIILINDGSTDNSLKICMYFKEIDKRIIIIDKKNEGLSIAREIGLRSAKGSYVIMMDSDDVLDSMYVEKMYFTIKKNSADICLCGRKIFDEKCEKNLYLSTELEDSKLISVKELETNYHHLTGEYQMSDSWNKIYRKQFILNTNVHFVLPRQYNGTDLLFNYLLMLHCPKISIVNEPLYYYRITPVSRVRRKDKHLEEGFNFILKELLKENRKCNGSIKIKHQILAAYVSMLKYASLDLMEEKGNVESSYRDVVEKRIAMSRNEILGVLRILPFEMKVFFVFLIIKSSKGIKVYYDLRNKMRKRSV